MPRAAYLVYLWLIPVTVMATDAFNGLSTDESSFNPYKLLSVVILFLFVLVELATQLWHGAVCDNERYRKTYARDDQYDMPKQLDALLLFGCTAMLALDGQVFLAILFTAVTVLDLMRDKREAT